MMNKQNNLSNKDLADVTGGNWEEQFREGYDNLQHNLDVSTYLGEFYQMLINGEKEKARTYYNSIKPKLYDQDKALFQTAFQNAFNGESL